MTTKKYFSALIFCLFIFSLQSLGQNHVVKFDLLNSQDGLCQPHVLNIIQDSRGFIWIATFGGLHRFDGYKMKVYQTVKEDSLSISNHAVHKVVEGRNGDLWIGTNAGLNRYDRKMDRFERIGFGKGQPEMMKTIEARSILIESDSIIWMACYNIGLVKYNLIKQSVQIFKHIDGDPNTLPSEKANVAIFDENKNIWVGTEYGGLSLFNKKTGKFTNFLPDPKNPASFENNTINAILPAKNGIFWVGSWNGGLSMFDVKKGYIKKYMPDDKNPQSISNKTVREMVYGPDGRIWIATFGGGLNVFDPKSEIFQSFKKDDDDPNSIASNMIWSLYFDKAGLLWVGNFGNGLNVLDNFKQRFPHFQKKKGVANSLSSSNLATVFEDHNGDLWIGTTGSGVSKLDLKTGKFSHFLGHESDYVNRIITITEDSKNNIWIGTALGVVKISPEQKIVARYTTKNGLSGDPVYSICEDDKGSIWISVWNAGVNRIDANELNKPADKIKIKVYKSTKDSSSIDHGVVFKIYKTKKNQLLFLSENAIQVFQAQTDNFKKISSIGSRCINEFASGEIWTGSSNEGIQRFTSNLETLPRITKNFKGILMNTLIEDKNNDIWIATESKLLKYNVKKDEVRTYGLNEGLSLTNFFTHPGIRLKSGALVFAGDGGYNLFKPDEIKDNTYIPQVVLTSFYLFNSKIENEIENEYKFKLEKQISEVEQINLNYDQNFFHFEFAGLSFASAKENKYAYMLKGFDKDWNQTNASMRLAFYTGVPPGKYVFMVKASNNDGYWNKKTREIIIIIRPPFWSTWWFKLLSAVLVIAIALSFYFYRINLIKRKNELLKRLVKEKTLDLQEANVMLLVKHDEILQQQEEIVAQNNDLENQKIKVDKAYELIKLKNEAINGSIRYALTIQKAILINENILKHYFEPFILFRPKDIVSGDFYWYAEVNSLDVKTQELVKIILIAVVDCTGHGVPGAFMSLISNTLLNDIVNKSKIYDPANILTVLNEEIISALRQENSDNNDGMDVCICSIQQQKATSDFKLLYTGAKLPLYYSRQNEPILKAVPARRSIGGVRYRREKEKFTHETINLKAGDSIYLCTDGFKDQNNIERKRFSSTRFEEVVNSNLTKTMQEQGLALDGALVSFMNGAEQRDDITVLGLKLLNYE